MPRMKKAKKSVKKARAVAVSPNLRAIEKIEKIISTEQGKLVKRYEKAVRAAERDVARLSAQLEKMRKAQKTTKPSRGRKPAKDASQKLEINLEVAKSELAKLALGHKKLLGEQKALAAFDKEWKKSSIKEGKLVKAAKPKKARKVATKKSAKNKQGSAAESAETLDAEMEMAS